MPKQNIVAHDKEHLLELIERAVARDGLECGLNHIDVSQVTDMSYLFLHTSFNGDISGWNVSNVVNMNGMFYRSKFNADVSSWDVSNVMGMSFMFYRSTFNADLSAWNVSNVTDMYKMFNESSFNGDISLWNVSNGTDMRCMFYDSKFKGDISRWSISVNTEIDFMIDSANLAWFETPTIFHWFHVLKDMKYMEEWPQDWQDHFMDHRTMFQGLGLEGLAAAAAMQDLWLENHSFE